MKDFAIRKIGYSNFEYAIFSHSYQNPLENQGDLEKELQKKKFEGTVLFDMLIPFGNSYNRYISIDFDGKHLDLSSLKVLDCISSDIKNMSTKYYQKNIKCINPYTLSSQELYKLRVGLPL